MVEAAGEKKKKLIRIKKRILQKFPRLSQVLKKARIIDDSCFGMGGCGYTDGNDIHINTSTSLMDLDAVLAHEAKHIERGDCDKAVEEPLLWNIATDAVINEELRNDGLPVHGGVNIAGAKSMGAEKLYMCLLAKKQLQQAAPAEKTV